MNQETLNDIKRYEKLPVTEEKKAINTAFLQSEIGSLEFYSKAMDYMRIVENISKTDI